MIVIKFRTPQQTTRSGEMSDFSIQFLLKGIDDPLRYFVDIPYSIDRDMLTHSTVILHHRYRARLVDLEALAHRFLVVI